MCVIRYADRVDALSRTCKHCSYVCRSLMTDGVRTRSRVGDEQGGQVTRNSGGPDESRREAADAGHVDFTLLAYSERDAADGEVTLLGASLLPVGAVAEDDEDAVSGGDVPLIEIDLTTSEPVPPGGLMSLDDVLNA